MWFLSKLKERKFYDCGDQISIAYAGDGMLNIRYKGSTVRMDVPSFVQYEWYKAYMQEQQAMYPPEQHPGPDPGQYYDFSRATDGELEMLLSDLVAGENYIGCIRVRNEIEKRKKN